MVVGNETLRAHCGACVGWMVLEPAEGLFRYVCVRCGYETPWRVSAAEAGEDVVWAAVGAGARKARKGTKDTKVE